MTPRFSEDGALSFLLRLQQLTQSSTAELEQCSNLLLSSLPPYLTSPVGEGPGLAAQATLVTNFEKTSLLVKSC
jgi:hypothetical protein